MVPLGYVTCHDRGGTHIERCFEPPAVHTPAAPAEAMWLDRIQLAPKAERAWASEPGLRVDARQCRLARRRLERAVRFGAAERVRAFCEGLRAELAAELASEEPSV